jgi:hypothetical protein
VVACGGEGAVVRPQGGNGCRRLGDESSTAPRTHLCTPDTGPSFPATEAFLTIESTISTRTSGCNSTVLVPTVSIFLAVNDQGHNAIPE